MPRPFQTTKTATVKFDYDALDPSELSVLAKEVINIKNLFICLLEKYICFFLSILDSKHSC